MSASPTNELSEVFGFLPGDNLDCTSTTFNCEDLVPPCNGPITGLIFSNIWTITEKYYKLCSHTGGWLSRSTKSLANAALSIEAADVIVGKGYTPYPAADVWSRLTTWKFPLIQLVATMPRPPLGIFIGSLTVLHLISDPIGSMENLLYKLEDCKGRLVMWTERIEHCDSQAEIPLFDEDRKLRPQWIQSLTIIAESYSELGRDIYSEADNALRSTFNVENDVVNDPAIARQEMARRQQERQKLVKECLTTAGALAADRATTVLPVVAAEALFVLIFVINLIRLKSGEESRVLGTTYANIEVHSIGFSILFFWLVPTVATAAVIGTSQTENAILRILGRFKRDLEYARVMMEEPYQLPELRLTSGHDQKRRFYPRRLLDWDESRCLYSIYSWQPYRRKPEWYAVLPALVVAFSILTGVLMSYHVPPTNWTVSRCRTRGELYFAIAWFGSYLLSYGISWLPTLPWYARIFTPEKQFSYRGQFYIMFGKDLAVMTWIVSWIYLTQKGWYNRADCYSSHNTGVVMPEQRDAFHEVQEGLRVGGKFATILALGISVQAGLIPLILCIRYWAVIQVFTLKDDMINDLSTRSDWQQAQPTQDASNGLRVPEPAHLVGRR